MRSNNDNNAWLEGCDTTVVGRHDRLRATNTAPPTTTPTINNTHRGLVIEVDNAAVVDGVAHVRARQRKQELGLRLGGLTNQPGCTSGSIVRTVPKRKREAHANCEQHTCIEAT